MAIFKIFPTQDTTLYSMYPDGNTGMDPILETSLSVNVSPNIAPQTSRILIQFSTPEIINVIDNLISGSSWESHLKLSAADISALNSDTSIELFPISQSWNMGTGKYKSSPEIKNGASWDYRDYENGNLWTDGTFNAGTTASYSSSVSVGGGTWYVTQSLSGSQNFSFYSDKDISIDATNIVNAWYSGSYSNNGFIIKQAQEFIDSEYVQPQLKFFSIDTHTIYPPSLEFKWVDNVNNTGSSSNVFLSTLPASIQISENPGIFYPSSINKFRVNARPEYPTRIFTTSSIYTTNYYLPTSSYYAIQDMYTNEYVVDFDPIYTKLSLDSTSSYFSLYMNGLEPERYYKILIKTTIGENIIIFDNDYSFKIVNE